MLLVSRILSSTRREFIRRITSGSGNIVKVSVNDDTGFGTVTMSSPPVNSLSLDMVTSLSAALTDLENNKCKGIILTSDLPTVFCAGLDINEIHKPDLDRYKKFWDLFQEVYLKLYLCSFPSVAAINGHSPAGGCVLALGCEYRIMVGPKFVIGLNETKVGVVAPPWLMDSMKCVLGPREAELALTTGKLYSSEQAVKVGLIDEVVSSKDEVLQRAEEFLNHQSNLPPVARSITKSKFRQPSIEWLINNRQEDSRLFYDFIIQPEVQQGLEHYLTSLKKK